ncbi:phosphoribosyltransferase [Candidatus Gottesmanbacteria bacterium]|nr:phosphoribosyltransferase [Candidatus Gottesmanbacteria bacterium]
MLLKNRLDAGILLADKLLAYRTPPVLILGLAKGGLVTAKGISGVLGVAFDVLVVKKLSSKLDPEFALGAVAPDHVSLIHWKDAHRMGADEEYMKKAVNDLSADVKRLMAAYRRDKKPLAVADKTIIIVDDGAATGATMEAAILWARKKRAKKIIAALPVAPHSVATKLRPEVDELIILHEMKEFSSVGSCYEEFGQVTDGEVVQLLEGDTV